ncbi:protein FAM19A5 [Arapaima gigas]
MAPRHRLEQRREPGSRPNMSSTFWAAVLLTTLLVIYCGKSRGLSGAVTDACSAKGRTSYLTTTEARCACKKGQIAGTTRARPACVEARIVRTKQWCEMLPCLEDEGCDLLVNRSGWTCTQAGGRVKTTTIPVSDPGGCPEFKSSLEKEKGVFFLSSFLL